MTRSRMHRGFSLVELLVASTIVIIAIAIASLGFIAQNKNLQALDMARGANSSGRDAMLPIESSLLDLGWGIDPQYAIDMKYNCPSSPCRDKINAPDEIAFVSRNPYYRWLDDGEGTCVTAGGCFSGHSWRVTSVNAGTPKTVTVTLNAGDVLEKGRVMLVTCASGANPVMITLSQRYTASGDLTPDATNAVPYNDWTSLQACHNATGAGLFMVDRFRYFVATYGGVPWLMLDTGLDLDADGNLPPTDTDDLIPIAKNVEDMQIAYAMQVTAFAAADSDGDRVVANASGTAEELDFTATAPVYTTPLTDASRNTLHPANVRAVRVSLTLRSNRTDQSKPNSWVGDAVPALENRSGTLSGGRYRRYTARTEVALRNMLSSPFTF